MFHSIFICPTAARTRFTIYAHDLSKCEFGILPPCLDKWRGVPTIAQFVQSYHLWLPFWCQTACRLQSHVVLNPFAKPPKTPPWPIILPQTIGDCFMAAFKDPVGALQAATEIQQRMHEAQWDPEIEELYKRVMEDREEQAVTDEDGGIRGLRVRIGMQIAVSGSDIKPKRDPVTTGYDHYGTAVNVAARMEAKAFGGEVLVTQDLVDEAGLPELKQRFYIRQQGTVHLKGVPGGKMAWRVLPHALSDRVLPERAPEEEAESDDESEGYEDEQDGSVTRLIESEAKRLGLSRHYLMQQVRSHRHLTLPVFVSIRLVSMFIGPCEPDCFCATPSLNLWSRRSMRSFVRSFVHPFVRSFVRVRSVSRPVVRFDSWQVSPWLGSDNTQ